MSSTEFSPAERLLMLRLARDSIAHGLRSGTPQEVAPDEYPAPLQAQRACFVTLTRTGQLRGCIGHLEPIQSLAEDVAENAYSAAFRDPRFPPLQAPELNDIHIEISVLGEPSAMRFDDEADLLRQIRPGVDGLILEDRMGHRGTFLPSVWESLPDPEQFLAHLKLKAGLPGNYWDEHIRVSRYTTEAFEEG